MVMPGVTVGEGAVIGPFSYVFRNIKPWTIVLGNPARKIGEREKVRFPDPDSD
jgi:acetyltransferase-like isoleucine patch superfamily enzyme